MDGLLIVDKPSGPTSHDVVARARRILRERRIGHTGTLDPFASGVLPLVVGRATRLARFLDGDKRYDAVLQLGVETDTYDLHGRIVSEVSVSTWPGRDAIDDALEPFRGSFLQQPPVFSAKKIDGERSYALARRARAQTGSAPQTVAPAPAPSPVPVTTHSIELLEVEGPKVRLRVHCEAGFYVRSLAHDVGQRLGVGAHLTALRRTAVGDVSLDRAVPLDVLERLDAAEAEGRLLPLDDMLTSRPAVALNDAGVTRARQGRSLGPSDASAGFAAGVRALHQHSPDGVRLVDQRGHLLAIAVASKTPGLLHPLVVLV